MGKSISSLKKSRKEIKKKHSLLESDSSDNKSNMKEPLKYYLPNFIKDTDIMVILHFFSRYLFQSNFNAPIEEELIRGQFKVLDIG